jgi:hypothetical protein
VGTVSGDIGVMILQTFGFITCSVGLAATLGALAGASIVAPVAIICGLSYITNLLIGFFSKFTYHFENGPVKILVAAF